MDKGRKDLGRLGLAGPGVFPLPEDWRELLHRLIRQGTYARLQLDFKGIPIVGSYLGLIGPNGNFSRNECWTETWTRSIQLQPGYASKPIRWFGYQTYEY